MYRTYALLFEMLQLHSYIYIKLFRVHLIKILKNLYIFYKYLFETSQSVQQF